MKNTIAILALLMSFNANAEVITLVANSTPPSSCKAAEPYDIYASHEIHIINASIMNESFHYFYQLCMDGVCDNAQNNITVYPGQHWDNSRLSHIQVRMTQGKHTYSVITECGKEKTRNDYTIKVS